MYFLNFDWKIGADVVSLRCLGSLFQRVGLWYEIIFHRIGLFYFYGMQVFFLYLMSWSCIWSFRQNISLMASGSKVGE